MKWEGGSGELESVVEGVDGVSIVATSNAERAAQRSCHGCGDSGKRLIG